MNEETRTMWEPPRRRMAQPAMQEPGAVILALEEVLSQMNDKMAIREETGRCM
jgi:hypothetical protein